MAPLLQPPPPLSAETPTTKAAVGAVYAGHRVVFCPRRKHSASKQFPFAFGGTGIFLSPGMLFGVFGHNAEGENRTLSSVLETCHKVYARAAGDERLGGCLRDLAAAALPGTHMVHLPGAADTVPRSLGAMAEVFIGHRLPSGNDDDDAVSGTSVVAKRPYAFHRIRSPAWFAALQTAEQAALPRPLSWRRLATYVLVPAVSTCGMAGAVRALRPAGGGATRCLPVRLTARNFTMQFD